MKFFDKKQDVIDVQLTQHGKRLLAEGKFKPKFYSFHDYNVLYDSEYGGSAEVQNDTEGRIQDDTPVLRTQYNFVGVDNSSYEQLDVVQNINRVEFMFPISKRTSLGTQQAPKWSMQFYDGKITSASGYFTGSNEIKAHIPQLDMLQKYRIIPGNSLNGGGTVPQLSQFQRYYFSDGTFADAMSEDIIVDIEEKFTPYENENISIEIFAYEEGPTRKLKKLNFKKQPVYVVDGVLLDEPIVTPDDFEINNTFVDYYLDVRVDSEITTDDLCNAVRKLKSRGIYLESAFECPDVETPTFPNIYQSNVEEEDVEDCE